MTTSKLPWILFTIFLLISLVFSSLRYEWERANRLDEMNFVRLVVALCDANDSTFVWTRDVPIQCQGDISDTSPLVRSVAVPRYEYKN